MQLCANMNLLSEGWCLHHRPSSDIEPIPRRAFKSAHLALGLAAPEIFQVALLLLQTRLKRLCLLHAAEQNLLLLSISLQQLLYLRLQALHRLSG